LQINFEIRGAAPFRFEGYIKCSTLEIVDKKKSRYASGSEGRRRIKVAAQAEATLMFFREPPSDEL
jgi:hypothetical protein